MPIVPLHFLSSRERICSIPCNAHNNPKTRLPFATDGLLCYTTTCQTVAAAWPLPLAVWKPRGFSCPFVIVAQMSEVRKYYSRSPCSKVNVKPQRRHKQNPADKPLSPRVRIPSLLPEDRPAWIRSGFSFGILQTALGRGIIWLRGDRTV